MSDSRVKEFAVPASDGCMLRGLWYESDPVVDPVATVVCLHGFSANAASMHWVAKALGRSGIASVLPDMRGHGLSDSSAGRKLKLDYLSTDVAKICQELGLERISLVTQSYGGWVGLELLRNGIPGSSIDGLYAFAPNWFSEPRKWSELRDWIPRTARVLWRLGRSNGFLSGRHPSRVDYGSYLGAPDFHLPRMREEVRSMSWPTYARKFFELQRLRHLPCPDWKTLSSLPVSIFAARDDRMWDNAELERIAAWTDWSLDWIECGHVGVATEEQYADAFVRRILEMR